jgi:hypothetical protein
MSAGAVYTGVLYEALDLASLPRKAHALARRWILVSSGLWGAVRVGDPIPPYRCSIGVSLPGLGGLGAYWRKALPQVLTQAAGGGLVIDLRSAAYAAMGSPANSGPAAARDRPSALAKRCVGIRVLQERTVNGVRTRGVVSHFNKAAKGRLVRDLALAGATPRSATALVATLRDLGYTVETHSPAELDIILPAGATPNAKAQNYR